VKVQREDVYLEQLGSDVLFVHHFLKSSAQIELFRVLEQRVYLTFQEELICVASTLMKITMSGERGQHYVRDR